MWNFLRRLLFEEIYPICPCRDLPDHLSLREIADLPPYHPDRERRR